jgi:hypothetical protein
MDKKFTRAQVEEHVSSLKNLLAEIGPDISAALTKLVLSKPGATKDEALVFLATHLTAKVRLKLTLRFTAICEETVLMAITSGWLRGVAWRMCGLQPRRQPRRGSSRQARPSRSGVPCVPLWR